MYGLVNRAIEELVIERAGRPLWEAVKRKADVRLSGFVSMESYPDSLTYDLVSAASEVLGASPEEILHDFGRHWILFTARSAYGGLFQMAGDSLADFLSNLDAMHSRLATTMPELVPPSFTTIVESENVYRVRYESTREGLAPMVVGLLSGLGELFETPVEVEHVVTRSEGSNVDEFLLTVEKRAESP